MRWKAAWENNSVITVIKSASITEADFKRYMLAKRLLRLCVLYQSDKGFTVRMLQNPDERGKMVS